MKDAGLENFSIELSKLSEYQIFLKVNELIQTMDDQFVLIDKYQNLGIKAWEKYINIINNNHKN